MRMVEEFADSNVACLRRLIKDHPEISSVTDADTAARRVVNTVELVVHHSLAGPGPVDSDRLQNELVAMLTRYLRGDR